MITDMERIGDQTQDIADILKVGNIEPTGSDTLIKMAQATMKMVTGSVDAYVQKDLVLTEEVFQSDDEVDRLFLEERGSIDCRYCRQSPKRRRGAGSTDDCQIF